MSVASLQCANCGAPLPPVYGPRAQCPYCGAMQEIARPQSGSSQPAALAEAPAPPSDEAGDGGERLVRNAQRMLERDRRERAESRSRARAGLLLLGIGLPATATVLFVASKLLVQRDSSSGASFQSMVIFVVILLVAVGAATRSLGPRR